MNFLIVAGVHGVAPWEFIYMYVIAFLALFWPLLIIPFTLCCLVVVAWWNRWRFSRRGLLIAIAIFALSCALSYALLYWWAGYAVEILSKSPIPDVEQEK